MKTLQIIGRLWIFVEFMYFLNNLILLLTTYHLLFWLRNLYSLKKSGLHLIINVSCFFSHFSSTIFVFCIYLCLLFLFLYLFLMFLPINPFFQISCLVLASFELPPALVELIISLHLPLIFLLLMMCANGK